MKISELIEELNNKMEELGDVEVVVYRRREWVRAQNVAVVDDELGYIGLDSKYKPAVEVE